MKLLVVPLVFVSLVCGASSLAVETIWGDRTKNRRCT